MAKRTLAETVDALIRLRPEWVKADGAINVTRASKAIGMNQPTLLRVLIGESQDPKDENKTKLCKALGVTSEQLMGRAPIDLLDGSSNPFSGDSVAERAAEYGVRREPILGSVFVKELDVNARLGPGNEFVDSERVVKEWEIEERELILASATSPLIITVSGRSMEPTLNDGEKILVNHEPPKQLNGGVYVLDSENGTQVKRVNEISDEIIRIVSDNPDKDTFPSIDLTPEEFAEQYTVAATVCQAMSWRRIN